MLEGAEMAPDELAPLKEQVYVDPRPAEYFDRFHAYARRHQPGWLYTFVRVVSYPYCRLVFKLRARDKQNVPDTGPVILAPNHFSAMDHWFVGILLRRRVRFMAKSQLFKGRVLEYILSRAGAFPVRRGKRDEESITTALRILRDGGMLVIYPEGGRSRSGRIGELGARPGLGRLALESGAPVVPVAIHGSERARNWRRLQFPAVTVAYGPPMDFGRQTGSARQRQQQVADEVLTAVHDLHDALSGRRQHQDQRERQEARARARA
jgi:1-acyl-sn-glycerol-3-phosphate acyltransferase